MAVLPIRITGDPVLHSSALPVAEFDEELHRLVADMIDTMHEAPGVGLAAPQVGVGLRVFVYDWQDGDSRHSGVAINPRLWVSQPTVDPLDDEAESEGCLSVPGERFPLRRSQHAMLHAFELSGQPYELEASGWLARIFQHEFDHLNGVLYVDRLNEGNSKLAAKAIKKRNWGAPGSSWLPGVDLLEGE
ncbi:MAG: peptide deformylase [Cryobacterium sp.]|nr:peptide deformylase [Cryobacterium sp.]